jgi:short-subunit dehydrogenase
MNSAQHRRFAWMSASPIIRAVCEKARLGLLSLGFLALLTLIFVSIVEIYEDVIAPLLSSRNLGGIALVGVLLFALIPFAYMAVYAFILCGIVVRHGRSFSVKRALYPGNSAASRFPSASPRRETRMSTGAQQGIGLITGASSGIGAIYADRLAKRGYDLILVARSQDRLQALAERLTGETGRRIETLAADLTVEADLDRVETRLRADTGITLLVNNAGIGATKPLLGSNVDKMTEMISLNITAVTRLTYAAAPGFVARGTGTLINIASIVALSPETLNGVYCGTKAFVLALSQSLQHELGSKGIRVQAVLPGATATEFWDIAGLPVRNLPRSMVMSATNLVDAALAGLDQGETVTIPSLPDRAEWDAYDAARRGMSRRLSRALPAARYGSADSGGDRST